MGFDTCFRMADIYRPWQLSVNDHTLSKLPSMLICRQQTVHQLDRFISVLLYVKVMNEVEKAIHLLPDALSIQSDFLVLTSGQPPHDPA